MSKVIFFIRVSTTQQNADLQRPHLQLLAQRDGVNSEDIIEIAEEGESASKLSFEDRTTIQRALQVIENEDVKCVYAWELSRIARRMDVLHRFINILSERHINLKTHVDGFVLLDDKGARTMMANMMAGLLGAVAQNESMMMKARQARDYEARVREGRACRRVPLGYCTDKKGHISIDEEQAKLIRLIYNKYSEGRMGLGALIDYLASVGVTMSYHQLKKILHNPCYAGGSSSGSKYNTLFPRLIDEETIKKVRAIQTAEGRAAWKAKTEHPASRLVVCPVCGRRLVTTGRNLACRANAVDHDRQCSYNSTHQSAYIDRIAWMATQPTASVMSMSEIKKTIAEQGERLEEAQAQLRTAQKNLEKLNEKRQRIEDVYIESGDKKRYESNMNKIKTEQDSLNRRIVELNATCSRIHDLLATAQSENENEGQLLYKAFDDINKTNDVQTMTRLVQKYVDRIEIEHVEEDKKKYVVLHVYCVNNVVYTYRHKKGRSETQMLTRGAVWIDVPQS